MVIFVLKQDRLSDDESADNLDEMDGGERESTLGRPEPMNEEQSDLPADENTTILPEDTRFVFVSLNGYLGRYANVACSSCRPQLFKRWIALSTDKSLSSG